MAIEVKPDDREIPDYPFFEVDGLTAAFGADRSVYLSKSEGSAVARRLPDKAEIFSRLFYVGGTLAEHSLRFRPEIARKGHATLKALMVSFEPSHEAKKGTVALALHHWCEPIVAEKSA
ncbi:hypothetical protein HME9302_00952 [Alteripontixanthobacter maritimus]|uniref:Uncharacterized protein n=1 Tax=Alteripontixanthobacter maritimus TaxID=2161824 RepID=A0A369Q918_9SPHN|nr:hypothetical protein [Alteripontixanthobacter maritimus]RDC59757.1 hypothetical protein HME9302_00952 [Alteripontixanthobacter maritimus]